MKSESTARRVMKGIDAMRNDKRAQAPYIAGWIGGALWVLAWLLKSDYACPVAMTRALLEMTDAKRPKPKGAKHG